MFVTNNELIDILLGRVNKLRGKSKNLVEENSFAYKSIMEVLEELKSRLEIQ